TAVRLNGKVAIVTGGTGGIGMAIVEAFAREGAKVAIFDIDGSALERAANTLGERGADVVTCHVDVTSSEEVRHGFEVVTNAFDTVDILVNNAGIFRTD